MGMFTPNSELVKQEVDAAVAAEKTATDAAAAADAQARVIAGLSSFLDTQWAKAKREKITIEQRMLESKRARNGQYEASKLAAIRALHGQDYVPVFAMLTETKCRAAESWIKEIIFPAGKIPWDLEPTPIPDLNPELKQIIASNVMQEVSNIFMTSMMTSPDPLGTQSMVMAKSAEITPLVEDAINDEIMNRAKQAAQRMKLKIADQFAEGGWEEAVQEAVHDLCTYQAAFVKGPYVVKESTRKRAANATTGMWENKIEDAFITKFERRSPFNIYPGPGGCTIDDTYLFDKISLTPKKLQSLLGVRGYNDAEITAVLEEGRSGKLKEWTAIDTEKAYAENRESAAVYDTDTIDCLEYWGSASGKDLLEWGMTTAEVPNSALYYDICAWKIGGHVIKAMMNPDPLGGKPYSKICFIEDPDNFWNKSLPEIIKHIQDMCNAVCRAMVNNVGIASGPQVEVNADRFPDGTDFSIWPWKVWESTNAQMQEGKAVDFYAPQLITTQLIELYNFFLTMADDESGVPRFASGSPVSGGAMDTASGFSMLISQAARGIKSVIANIDQKLIEPTVRRQYYYNLDFEDISENMVGDVKIIAKGTASLVSKEQQAVRKRELLGETNNPIDMQIIGTKGRHEMLKDMLIALDMDAEKILPGEQELDRLAAMIQAGIPQGQPGLPAPGQPPMAGPGKAPSPASETTAIDGGQPSGGDAAVSRDQEKP